MPRLLTHLGTATLAAVPLLGALPPLGAESPPRAHEPMQENTRYPDSFLTRQNPDRAEVIRRGNTALATRVATVVEKPRTSPTGNAHDYISYAIYYWPDPQATDGLPFVPRDGERNEKQVNQGDAPRFRQLFSEVKALAVAWHFTRNADYARKAGDWLRAWLVAPETRMTPNLQGAQIRLGHDNNLGQSGGIIDAARLRELLEAIRLLEHSPALSAADEVAMRAWLNDYYHWLVTSENGRQERKKPNNHGTWYLSQAAGLAAYLGRTSEARDFLSEARERIGSQIGPDGRQPLELRRADGFSYSVYNLDAYFGLALLGEQLGVDLWHYEAPGGGSLRKAIDYLLPYSGSDRTVWPGKQHRTITGRELDSAIAIADRVWPQANYARSLARNRP